MGILASVGSKLVKAFYKVADPIITAVAEPIKSIKAGISKETTFKQVQQEFFAKPKLQQAAEFTTSALAIGGGVAAGVAAKAGSLGAISIKAGQALLPKTTKSRVIAAVAAPVVIGAVVKQPDQAIGAAARAPIELAKFGSDVADFASDPSIANAKQIITESPIISATIGGLAVLGTGKLVAPVIGGLLQKEAIEDQTKALEKSIEGQATQVLPSNNAPMITSSAPQSPPTPQTQTLTTTSSSVKNKRRRSVRSTRSLPNISQKVAVIVQNKSSSVGIKQEKKNYLNRRILAT